MSTDSTDSKLQRRINAAPWLFLGFLLFGALIGMATHPHENGAFVVGLMFGQVLTGIPLVIAWRAVGYLRGGGKWSIGRWLYSLAVVLWIIAALGFAVGFLVGLIRG